MPELTRESVLTWVVIGLVVGLLGRLLFDTGSGLRGWLRNPFLAVAGSAVGGLIASALRLGSELSEASAWVVSIIGAALALLLYHRIGAENAIDDIT